MILWHNFKASTLTEQVWQKYISQQLGRNVWWHLGRDVCFTSTLAEMVVSPATWQKCILAPWQR